MLHFPYSCVCLMSLCFRSLSQESSSFVSLIPFMLWCVHIIEYIMALGHISLLAHYTMPLSSFWRFVWKHWTNAMLVKHMVSSVCLIWCQFPLLIFTQYHYKDVIMGTIASQITSLTIVYSTVYGLSADPFPFWCLLENLYVIIILIIYDSLDIDYN